MSAAVSFVALNLVLFGAWRWAPELLGVLWSQPQAAASQALWQLLRVLTFGLLVVLGAQSLPLVLLAPLQDPISEATEAILGGAAPAPFRLDQFLRGLFTSLTHTLARVGLLWGGNLLLLPLHLLPAVGSIVWAIATVLWTSFWLAGEYLDICMARHLYPFASLRRLLWERRALCLGFGLSLYVLLWVPVLNLFLMPLAIVAGTLLFRAMLDEGSLQAPGSPG